MSDARFPPGSRPGREQPGPPAASQHPGGYSAEKRLALAEAQFVGALELLLKLGEATSEGRDFPVASALTIKKRITRDLDSVATAADAEVPTELADRAAGLSVRVGEARLRVDHLPIPEDVGEPAASDAPAAGNPGEPRRDDSESLLGRNQRPGTSTAKTRAASQRRASSRTQASLLGGALLPPRPMPETKFGPESDNYYDDPTLSK
ncbi:hypothetical protein Q6346_14715 [Isoptericola sp. b490]|uniref:hypothetical protein n=1 Tax=Actinotalea lenta TaxID=3064654 RepID=UPI002712EA84|nr:hypothetical protein [Isoptericola sp. b490]MDO8122560.1 hypothetical protein [Isoptericola sp. b490]